MVDPGDVLPGLTVVGLVVLPGTLVPGVELVDPGVVVPDGVEPGEDVDGVVVCANAAVETNIPNAIILILSLFIISWF